MELNYALNYLLWAGFLNANFTVLGTLFLIELLFFVPVFFYFIQFCSSVVWVLILVFVLATSGKSWNILHYKCPPGVACKHE